MLESFRSRIAQTRRALVLAHSNADPDAIASIAAIKHIAEKINPIIDVKIAIPEGISTESRRIVSSLNLQVDIVRRDIPKDIEQYLELCIVVDTASLEQLKTLSHIVTRCKQSIVIDHHSSRALSLPNALEIVIPASSSSEIVFSIAIGLGIDLPKNILDALLAGVIYDTRRFSRGDKYTFAAVAYMLSLGASLENALSLTRTPQPPHQRIAVIKCVLRHRGFRLQRSGNDVYLAISEVGAYESNCASALIALGYDIAIVLTEDDLLKAVRAVYRAKEDVLEKLGIDVYRDIVSIAVEKFGGSGGGHRAAGAAIVRSRDVDEVARTIIEGLGKAFENVFELAEERVG